VILCIDGSTITIHMTSGATVRMNLDDVRECVTIRTESLDLEFGVEEADPAQVVCMLTLPHVELQTA
jgi:hypothetical protein